MSWAENEKLNEWIERAFENGKREEQERIIKLVEEVSAEDEVTWNTSELIALIKGEYCECDPCDNPECKCRGKRCSFCLGQDENR